MHILLSFPYNHSPKSFCIISLKVFGVNKKKIDLGVFENKEDTIKARKEAEDKYYGEYSYDNSMKGDENNEQKSQI